MSLNTIRIQTLHHVMSAHVDRDEMPGLVGLVSYKNDQQVETIGNLAFGDSTPMEMDTIFRIASLTKLVTAVAAMILIEECKIRLDDSIEPFIPELANRQVLKSIESEIDQTVPANRPITVRDLLTFRMGFGSVMAMPDTYPIQKYIRDYKIGGDGPPIPSKANPTDGWLEKLGSLPLIHQPGERWMYNASADVLGILISRVSGKSLGEFMNERIFKPLGMKDTAFNVPEEKLPRLATSYVRDRTTDRLATYDDPVSSAWQPEPPMESGGGGLVSTMQDYFKFCKVMLSKGGKILSKASIELMTSDQLTPENRIGGEPFFGGYRSWGLGMAVDIGQKEIYHSPGRYGWEGGLGTAAYIDPANQMICILFTQRMMESPEWPRVFTDFYTLAYSAME